MKSRARVMQAVLALFSCVAASSATASTIQIGVGAFGPGATLVTFAGLADGTEVNGLLVGGIQFEYSLGNGMVIIDGGPGTTNNIASPNVVSVRDPGGILTLTLPSFVDSFGFGYAVSTFAVVPNATMISLFNGIVPVGSQSYASVPDPMFAGGFAGIQSTDLFNRVQLTFNSVAAPAFALDNIRTQQTVPEPVTLTLLAAGVLASARRARGRPR